MSKRMAEILARRSQLLARSDTHRAALTLHFQQLQRPVRIAELGLSIVSALKAPLAVAGIAALIFKSRGASLGRWPRLLWKGWRLFQSLRRFRTPSAHYAAKR